MESIFYLRIKFWTQKIILPQSCHLAECMLNKGPSFLILLLMGHVQSTLQWWGSLHAAEHGTKTAKHVHSSVGGVLFTSYLLMHLGNHFSRGPFADKRCSLTCFGIESERLLSQGDPYSSLNPEPFGLQKPC